MPIMVERILFGACLASYLLAALLPHSVPFRHSTQLLMTALAMLLSSAILFLAQTRISESSPTGRVRRVAARFMAIAFIALAVYVLTLSVPLH